MVYPVEWLKVQAYTYPEDAFVVGVSRLDHGVLTVGSGDITWRDIECDANTLHITRGGDVDGPSIVIDTGILTVTLVNSGDPLFDAGFLPNVPIRVMGGPPEETQETLFTGHVEDVTANYDRDGNVFVSLTAVDGVRELKNTPRYGAVAPDYTKVTSFGQRWEALRSSTSLPGRPGHDSPSEEISHEKLWYLGDSRDGWSRWGDDPEGIEPEDIVQWDYVFVGDKLRDPSETFNYFGYSRGVEFELDYPFQAGKDYAIVVAMFTQDGALENTFAKDHNEDFYSYAAGITGGSEDLWGTPVVLASGLSIDANTGLSDHPHNSLWVGFRAEEGVSNYTLRVARTMTEKIGGVAESSSGWGIERPEAALVASVVVVETDGILLQDVNYESTVYNHLDLAATTGLRHWWIDAENTLQWRRKDSTQTPSLTLSDSSDYDPHVCYTNIVQSYDTRNIVNQLEILNHGRKIADDSDVNWLVDDEEFQFTNNISVGLYNSRLHSLDTCAIPDAVPALAERVFDLYKAPEAQFTSVRVNVLENPEILKVGLFTLVDVVFRKVAGTYLVVGVTHEVEHKKWFITFQIRKEN